MSYIVVLSANSHTHESNPQYISPHLARPRRGPDGLCPGQKRVQPHPDRRDLARHRARRPRRLDGRPRRRHRSRRQLPVLEPVEICLRIFQRVGGPELHPVAAQTRQRHLPGQSCRLLENRFGRQPGPQCLAALLLPGRGDQRQRHRRRGAEPQPLRNGL